MARPSAVISQAFTLPAHDYADGHAQNDRFSYYDGNIVIILQDASFRLLYKISTMIFDTISIDRFQMRFHIAGHFSISARSFLYMLDIAHLTSYHRILDAALILIIMDNTQARRSIEANTSQYCRSSTYPARPHIFLHASSAPLLQKYGLTLQPAFKYPTPAALPELISM